MGGEVVVLGGSTMGTRWSLRFAGDRSAAARIDRGLHALFDRVIGEMSQWEPASVLSRFNRSPAGWRDLPPDFFQVLDAALRLAEQSGGAFDPTIGALVDRWGFGPEAIGTLPGDDQVAALAEAAGWTRIEIDRPALRAYQPGGVKLDLAGIAKGYAVDLAARSLLASGLRHFLIEIGGEFVGQGVKSDGEPWWVDVEAPPSCELPPLRVALCGIAVATSGDYRRAHQGGSHSIDPRTGRPIANGVVSVTVLHDSCMMADGLATAITVLGPQEGMAFAEARGVAAHIVSRKGDGFAELLSQALAAMLD